jgi:hypothetical protein
MNKHLEDLMYLAGLTAQGCWDEMDTYDKLAIEKLAQLIVKKCAKVCRDQTNEYALPLDRENCAAAIEEHFGVE